MIYLDKIDLSEALVAARLLNIEDRDDVLVIKIS